MNSINEFEILIRVYNEEESIENFYRKQCKENHVYIDKVRAGAHN